MDLDRYVGKAIEVEDPANLDQCFDWALFVCNLLGIPREAIRTLYAKDIWTHYDPNYFDKVADPQPLDFAIWGGLVGQAGHVGIVKEKIRGGFRSWDQNWDFIQTVQVIDHNLFGVLGFLRPKPPQGGNMADLLSTRVLSALVLGNNGKRGTKDALAGQIDDELKKFEGQALHDVLWQFYDSAQGKQYREYVYARPDSEDPKAEAKLDQIKQIIED